MATIGGCSGPSRPLECQRSATQPYTLHCPSFSPHSSMYTLQTSTNQSDGTLYFCGISTDNQSDQSDGTTNSGFTDSGTRTLSTRFTGPVGIGACTVQAAGQHPGLGSCWILNAETSGLKTHVQSRQAKGVTRGPKGRMPCRAVWAAPRHLKAPDAFEAACQRTACWGTNLKVIQQLYVPSL